MPTTGEIWILLTMAYMIFISSTLTIWISFLGNNVIASHQSMKRKVGLWISLVLGWVELSLSLISFQKSTLSNPSTALSKLWLQFLSKPSKILNCFQVKVYCSPNNLNVTCVAVLVSVHKNSMVSCLHPSSFTRQKFYHPIAWKITWNSVIIPVRFKKSWS